MNLVCALSDLARSDPTALALVLGERRMTRDELDTAVRTAAAGLARLGLGPGSVAAVVPAADRMLHAVLVLALARCGIVHLPLRAAETPGRAAALARAAGATMLIADRASAELPLPHVPADPDWLRRATPDAAPAIAEAADRPWIIAQSSGSTGRPKAIPVTHAMEIARTHRDRQAFQHHPGERFLTLIEAGFYNSTSAMVRCLAQGGTVVLDHAFRSIGDLIDTTRRHGVRFLQMTPSHLFALVEVLPDGAPALPELRVLRISSAALPRRMHDLARRRLADCVHLTYGTNEAGTLAVAGPDLLAREPATVGQPLDGIAFEVVDGEDRPAAAGQPGFVRVRGPGVMPAYLDDPEATWQHCRNGWFYPGDIATRSAEGLVHLKGRSDRVLNIGGVLTGAEEIEALLASHPCVAEAAVVPLPSERFDVVPAIAVVLRGPVPLSELAAQVRASLRGFPVAIVPVPALPRNPMGKTDYPALTRMVACLAAGDQAEASSGNSDRSRS